MNDMSLNTAPTVPDTRAIVGFGQGGCGKAQLSRFNETEVVLAAKLPQGRVFARGPASVPFVKAGLYGSLAAIANVDPHAARRGPEPASTASPGAGKPGQDEAGEPSEGQPGPDTDGLAVGTVVLAFEGPGMGWWEAVILRTQGNLITLRWRDYADMAQIVRRRDHLAHLPPGVEPG